MSLIAYEKLTKLPSTKLGVQLPKLQQGNLQISSSVLGYEELLQKVNGFAPEAGWVMARDKVTRTLELPKATDLLEAEFCHGSQSLHVRLEAEGKYRCTQLFSQKEGSMLYRDQTIFARDKGGLMLVYRLWWQIAAGGIDDGRVRPLAQQFIGFVSQYDTEAS